MKLCLRITAGLCVGMKLCLRITAGLCVGMLRNLLTRGKPKENDLMKPPHDSLHTEPPARYSSINVELLEYN